MLRHPFAMLCTHGNNGLGANHLPFQRDTNGGKSKLSQNKPVRNICGAAGVLLQGKLERVGAMPQAAEEKSTI